MYNHLEIKLAVKNVKSGPDSEDKSTNGWPKIPVIAVSPLYVEQDPAILCRIFYLLVRVKNTIYLHSQSLNEMLHTNIEA